MDATVVLVLLFVFILILISCLIYILILIPAKQRRMRRRLEGLPVQGQAHGDLPGVGRASDGGSLNRFTEILAKPFAASRFHLFVVQSGSQKTVGQWISIMLILVVFGAIILLLSQPPLVIAVLMIAVLGSIPLGWLAFKRSRRFTQFEQQFPSAMDVLARAVRAGYAFTTGLEIIADEMPEPVSSEFRRVYEQQNLGLPLRDALRNMSLRVPLPDVRIFVSTLQIQSESGGNLAEVLDKLSSVVRERFRLMRQVRIYSAEGRMSLVVLMAFAPVVCVASYFVNPRYGGALFADSEGLRLLGFAAILQIIGFFVIRRMVNFKV